MGIHEFVSSGISFKVLTPSHDQIVFMAACVSASNIVDQLHRVQFPRFVKKPLLRFLYRHVTEYDMTNVVETQTMKPWDFSNFHPANKWTAETNDNLVIIRFRSEEDKILFRLAVL